MRIRSIMPDFWRSEDIARLDWHARLVFIGLWSYVDDNGVGRDDPRLIVADLFPLDGDAHEGLMSDSRDSRECVEGGVQMDHLDIPCTNKPDQPVRSDPREVPWNRSKVIQRVIQALAALDQNGQIERFNSDGKRLLFIRTWDRYQRVVRPSRSRYPRPTCENANAPTPGADSQPSASPARTRPSRDTHETLATGEGEKGRRKTTSKACPAELDDRDDPTLDRFEAWWRVYRRREAKGRAKVAYAKAVKLIDPEKLEKATEAWFNSRPGLESKFTPLPASWLNAHRWLDEKPPSDRPTSSRPSIDEKVQEGIEIAKRLEMRFGDQSADTLQIGDAE